MGEIHLKQYIYRYPHPAVTTDCVILTFHEGLLRVLLIKRGIDPYKGQWALPGGFMKIDESAEDCAHRELREETGVIGCPIKQFHTFSRPGRDPRERVVSIAFYALVKWQQATGADDAEYADWIPMNNVPPLAFDHEEILKKAMEAIRRDIFFEPIGFQLLNDLFSMPELQKVYEAILGKQFDRRNFAKKMKHLGILDEVSKEEENQKRLEMDWNQDNPIQFMENPEPPVAAEESIFSVIDKANGVKSKSTPKSMNFFRFNKKKYNKMKEDDFLEF